MSKNDHVKKSGYFRQEENHQFNAVFKRLIALTPKIPQNKPNYPSFN